MRKPRRKRVSRKAKRGVYRALKCVLPINYRSGWELEYAKWLDACPSVLSYKYEPYAVGYVSNMKSGKLRKYYPDFEVTYTDGTKALIEIKPKKKVTLARNVKKFAAASAHCLKQGIDWRVVTEVDLKALGLLK